MLSLAGLVLGAIIGYALAGGDGSILGAIVGLVIGISLDAQDQK